jgi:hypothetical protein
MKDLELVFTAVEATALGQAEETEQLLCGGPTSHPFFRV